MYILCKCAISITKCAHANIATTSVIKLPLIHISNSYKINEKNLIIANSIISLTDVVIFTS